MNGILSGSDYDQHYLYSYYDFKTDLIDASVTISSNYFDGDVTLIYNFISMS